MKTVKTTSNQTVFDLAVEHYGTIEAVGEIMSLNTLKNDPQALLDADINEVNVFYPDIALPAGFEVIIDENSSYRRPNILKELDGRTITTFDNGKNYF